MLRTRSRSETVKKVSAPEPTEGRLLQPLDELAAACLSYTSKWFPIVKVNQVTFREATDSMLKIVKAANDLVSAWAKWRKGSSPLIATGTLGSRRIHLGPSLENLVSLEGVLGQGMLCDEAISSAVACAEHYLEFAEDQDTTLNTGGGVGDSDHSRTARGMLSGLRRQQERIRADTQLARTQVAVLPIRSQLILASRLDYFSAVLVALTIILVGISLVSYFHLGFHLPEGWP